MLISEKSHIFSCIIQECFQLCHFVHGSLSNKSRKLIMEPDPGFHGFEQHNCKHFCNWTLKIWSLTNLYFKVHVQYILLFIYNFYIAYMYFIIVIFQRYENFISVAIFLLVCFSLLVCNYLHKVDLLKRLDSLSSIF